MEKLLSNIDEKFLVFLNLTLIVILSYLLFFEIGHGDGNNKTCTSSYDGGSPYEKDQTKDDVIAARYNSGIQICVDDSANIDDSRNVTISWDNNVDEPDHAGHGWHFNHQEEYWVQIAKDSDFNNIVYDTGKISSSSTSHTVDAGELDRMQDYYYRVAIRDGRNESMRVLWGADVCYWDGGWTAWTGCYNFYLPSLPPNPPENLDTGQPDDCSQDAKIEFTWDFSSEDEDEGNEQTSYRLQVDDSGGDFSNPVHDTGQVDSSTESYTTTFADNFSYGNDYDWRVKTWGAGEEELDSDWADDSFRKERPQTESLSVSKPDPEDYCSESSPPNYYLSGDFSSPDNYELTHYELQVSSESDYSDPETATGKTSLGDASDIEHAPHGLDFDTDYYWRVRIWDEKCNVSDWNTDEFTTNVKRADPGFEYNPSEPYPDETVHFSDDTEEGHYPTTEWRWTFEGGDPSDGSGPETATEFKDEDEWEVTLEVEDQEGVVCPVTESLPVGTDLPDWEETDPFN